jgi:hypothetical protein
MLAERVTEGSEAAPGMWWRWIGSNPVTRPHVPLGTLDKAVWLLHRAVLSPN